MIKEHRLTRDRQVTTMDLIKMHPMARKMNAHNEGLNKAIEDGNADEAEFDENVIEYASVNLEENNDELLSAIKLLKDYMVSLQLMKNMTFFRFFQVFL